MAAHMEGVAMDAVDRHMNAIWARVDGARVMLDCDRCELLRRVTELQAERAAIEYAAHMPADYEHGLPTWINMQLYGRLIGLLDTDGRVIRRSEDVEAMILQQRRVAELEALLRRILDDPMTDIRVSLDTAARALVPNAPTDAG